MSLSPKMRPVGVEGADEFDCEVFPGFMLGSELQVFRTRVVIVRMDRTTQATRSTSVPLEDVVSVALVPWQGNLPYLWIQSSGGEVLDVVLRHAEALRARRLVDRLASTPEVKAS
jgi:hypothetical protein